MDDIEKVVIQHTEQIKTLFNRTEQQQRMMDSLNDLTISVKEIALGLGQVKDDVGGLQTDVETLKQKPAKKWEDVTGKVLWAILAAVLGLILGKFGL